MYDTGGLSIKSKEGMPGMKADCGGAAALLGAFEAAVEIGVGDTALHLVLCLAENAIGPGALRNDDVSPQRARNARHSSARFSAPPSPLIVHALHDPPASTCGPAPAQIIQCLSGLTCEINNSDAEGRLVLADGVAHATALPARLPGLDGQPDVLIDMATLTGAQLVATGKRHAGIVSNEDELEGAAVKAGKLSGDTVHPLPFCPEFYSSEFTSQVRPHPPTHMPSLTRTRTRTHSAARTRTLSITQTLPVHCVGPTASAHYLGPPPPFAGGGHEE